MKENLFERNPKEATMKQADQNDHELTPGIETEKRENTLVPEHALSEEKRILQKLLERLGSEKTRRIIASLILTSTLAAGTFEAHASGKKQDTVIEQTEHNRREQIAIALIERLLTTPDMRAARMRIEAYALRHKLGFPEGNISGRISRQDIKEALEELNVILYLFADQNYGNNDGKGDPQELNKMLQTHKNNPGFQTLIKMMQFAGVREQSQQ